MTPAGLDRSAVLAGVGYGLALAVPVQVVGFLADADSEGVGGLAALAGIVAFGLAGWRGARDQSLTPLMHGAVAGALTGVAVFLLATALGPFDDDDEDASGAGQAVLQLFLNLLFSAVAGMLGALISRRRATR